MQYWIAVASRDHVQKAIAGGFAQVCHGKKTFLNKMNEDDWIIYYSPVIKFGSKEPYQCFTALGKVKKGHPYQFSMTKDFIPWRRKISFLETKDVSIKMLLENLSFIKNKQKWGFIFRYGFFEIPESDFRIIREKMEV